MEFWLTYLYAIIAVFCLMMVILGYRRPLNPQFDGQVTLIMLVLAGYFGARILHFPRLENLLWAIFYLLFFVFVSRLYRLAFGPWLRFTLLTAGTLLACFSILSPDVHGPFLNAARLTYQVFIFVALLVGSLRGRSKFHRFERALRNSLFRWLILVIVVTIIDVEISRYFGIERKSAVLIVPFTHWMIFSLSASPLDSYLREMRNLCLDFLLAAVFVLIASAYHLQLTAQSGFELWALFATCFYAYRALRLRRSVVVGRAINLDLSLAREITGGTTQAMVQEMRSHPLVADASLVSASEAKSMKVESLLQELQQSPDPLFRPTSAPDWIRLQQLSDWERQSLLFAWDALDADVATYFTKTQEILRVKLRVITLKSQEKEAVLYFGRALREHIDRKSGGAG